jgi:Tfp pilus assembly protein PilN
MLRTNLSTRPFYNERLVHVSLAALAAIVVAVSAFNLQQVFVLSGRQASAQGRMAQHADASRALRTEASRLRGSINPLELEATTAASREANTVIGRRAFSWTDLFNRFEATLPDDVRIASVRPKVDRLGVMTVTIIVVSRGVEGVNTFIENLEQDGAFDQVLSTEEFMDEEGQLQASLEGRYRPPAPPPAAAPPAGKGARP